MKNKKVFPNCPVCTRPGFRGFPHPRRSADLVPNRIPWCDGDVTALPVIFTPVAARPLTIWRRIANWFRSIFGGR